MPRSGELAGADDAADDSSDDSHPDDALAFLAALLPNLLTSPAVGESQSGETGPAQQTGAGVQPGVRGEVLAPAVDPNSAKGPQAANLIGSLTAASSNAAGMDSSGAGSTAGHSQHFGGNGAASTAAPPPIDSNSLNALTASADLFAHHLRHGSAERADVAVLNTPVRDPRWADELGARVATMVRTGETSASLQLHPGISGRSMSM